MNVAADAKDARRFMRLCIVPLVLFLLLVSVAPSIVAITDSLRELSLTEFTKRGAFIGLDNYRHLLRDDPAFFAAIGRTILFVAVAVPIEFALGLAIALVLNREFRMRRFVITALMLPTMVAPVVVGMMWRYLLMPSFGLLTYYMQAFGLLENAAVFSQPASAYSALIAIDIWEWTPFMMLIMTAGLSAVPQEPIEAATMDGAGVWQILRHIQLPFLRPLIIFACMFRAIEASKVFDTIYVLTGGGPGTATETISVFAYRTNFIRWDLGYGAAVCLLLAFFSLVVAALFYKIVNAGREVSR
jgi:multiple sugar transport system permease protein